MEGAIVLYEDLIASNMVDDKSRHDLTTENAFWPCLALCYYEIGRFDKALALCDIATVRCLRLWLRMGRADAVLARAQTLLNSENPRNRSNGIRYRARALVALDSLDAARELAQQLYDLEPSRGGIVRNRADQISADIALAEGDPKTALEILDRMKADGTSSGGLLDIDYRETRAEAYRQAGRYDEAVEVLKTLLGSYGWHSMAYLQLGRIYQEMGKNTEAEEALLTFLDRWKNADEELPDLEDVRARLAVIQEM